MRITPLDVRKQEFRRSVRGFDCDEVRAFLATLADEYEIVLVDNKQIREKLMQQEEKITEYKTMERTLRDTLMTAEKLMQETRENANKEGDLILRDAKLKASQVLQECRLRTEELRREIEGLRKEKENYLGRFKSLAESQIQFIESHRNDFKDLDDRLTGIVDSVVEGAAVRAAEAEKETVVDTIVEAMIQPEAKGEIATSASAAPASSPIASQVPQTPDTAIPTTPATAGSEQDIWRNYNPGQANAAPETTPAESRTENETGNETGNPAGTEQPTAEGGGWPNRPADANAGWSAPQTDAETVEDTENPNGNQDHEDAGQPEQVPQGGDAGNEAGGGENRESGQEEVRTETINI